MVGGGLPEGSGIVLQGPAGSEKVRFALAFLAEGLRTGGSGVLVIASQTAESTLSELRALGVDLDAVAKENRLRIVDWYSWSEEPVTDVEERGIILRSSVDLSSLGAALSRAIAALPNGPGKRAVIEMLSPALNVYELTQVYAFAQSSKRKLDRFSFTSVFLVEKDMHQAAVLSTLAQPFDGVIEIERTRTGDRIVRKIGVLHLRETTPIASFVPLELTDKGFRVLSPAGHVPLPPASGTPPQGPAPGAAPGEAKKLVRPPLSETESAAVRRSRDQLILEIAKERLRVDPTDKDAWFALAAGQATLQDIEGSLASLDKLAALDPRYPGLWVLKAKLHARLGQEEEWRQARMKADEYEEPSAAPSADLVPCPICAKPIAPEASLCPHCGSRTESEEDIIEELETLTKVTIQDIVEDTVKAPALEPEAKPSAEEEAPAEARPQPEVAPKAEEEVPADYERTLDELAELVASPEAPPPKALARTRRGEARKGLTNGLIMERAAARRAASGQGRTNGLTNGLRGHTNGLTNGLGRTNGLTNGLGHTNGLTNGLRGRTNGLTNGLRGRTNGLTNGLGRTNGLRKMTGMTKFQRRLSRSPWTRYGIPLAVIAVLIVPLFFLWGNPAPTYPIAIDGQFGDWSAQSIVDLPGASTDPNIRLVRFGTADNLDYLAFYVEVAGTVLQGGGPAPGRMDTVRVFLDTDNSSATGYRIDGIGADRLLEVSGFGGQVLGTSLLEFDANRDALDWNGWIKGTSFPAAAAGSRVELEAPWINLRDSSAPVRAAVRTQSWDGLTDSGQTVLSPTAGTLSLAQTATPPAILSGTRVPLLDLTAIALRESVTFASVDVDILGTAPATAATSIALLDSGGNVLAQAAPSSSTVVLGFAPQQIDAGGTRTYSIVGDFASTTGDTYGVRIPSADAIGVTSGVTYLEMRPSSRSLGYVGVAPAGPRVDGGFGEWTAATADSLGESTTGGNTNIDLAHYGAIHNGTSLYLYTDVSGRIFAGTGAPEQPRIVTPTAGNVSADTDRDTVPDTVDPMPYDFNNDGIPDAQTNGDYDADGITDYGFPGGTDYWLNTTIPATFPSPYAGRTVSVYIGPTYKPPLQGEDILRFFLDTDNSTSTGYSIGGIGADRLIEVRGKDGIATQSSLLGFSGSYPGEWSWTALAPITVALGYHAVELAVNFNAFRVYVEAGDFWGAVDTSDSSAYGPFALSASSVAGPASSFIVSPATTSLSVPWYQAGPRVSATSIDPGSGSVSTIYNQQRKVVRAPDVALQTACDATNADGCWYVVFYDQVSSTSYTSAPSTEAVTTGTKVAGTFPSNIDSSNNAYVQYREANTGTTTVSTRNAGALGTSPACAWTTCSSGETSDNAYATSTQNNQIISFKTFGFAVPSGASLSQVRIGIEAFQAAGGDDQINGIALSWNAGTTYCSNTLAGDPFTPVNTGDPNAYTYFDTTTCTGHTWAQADFATGTDNIAFQAGYRRNGGTATQISVDAVVVEVTYVPTAYQLLVRYDFSSVPTADTQTLQVEAYHGADENVNVEVLTPPSTWNSRITITATTDPNSAQAYVLTSSEYNSGSPSIRFVDASGADTTQTDLWVDSAIIVTTMTKSPTTETLTTGSKVAGTFPTDVGSADSTYIQYREANGGTTTVSTRNPGAVGTAPACTWTGCASGETSDNSYATSVGNPNQLLSFKTFGFAVPSGASLSQVRIGIEAFQAAGGDDQINGIALSWNAGTTYCSNTLAGDPFTPVNTGDPNAYTYFDTTTCTGHTWAQADFATGTDNIAFQATYKKVGGIGTQISVDAVVVEVTYVPISYQASVRYDWANVASGDAYTLTVKGYRQDEDINVQVLTPPSTWATRITISATSNTLYTYALTTSEFNSGAPSVRFVDAGGGDTTQSDFWLDQAVITTTSVWDRVILMRSADTGGTTWGSQVILASGRTGDDPLLYAYDSAEPAIAMDSAGYLHVAWVSAASLGNQATLNLVRYTKSTVAYPTQAQVASATNWQAVTSVDDANPGYMSTVSTDSSNYAHIAWSGSKSSGTVFYKNDYGGSWRSTISWGTAYTGVSVDISPANNYVSLARYYDAATNEIQYTVCKNLATSNCDASAEFTKWDGTAGYDTVATAVEAYTYPSLATTYDANGDLWIAYAKDVDGTTRAIYARFLDYPSTGFASPETVDSLSGTIFTRPTIGIDRSGNVHAMYVAASGPQLYYKMRLAGTWGSRLAIDTSSDNPSLVVRGPNDATYGYTPGAIYWKSSTSETYFVAIPEFESVFVPIFVVLGVVVFLRRRVSESVPP